MDRRRDPWSRQSLGVTAQRQARMRARAYTARTVRLRHARHDHSVHGSVTERTPWYTARSPRSRPARSGHGAHVRSRRARLGARRARLGHGPLATVTARTDWSRRARIGHCAHASMHGAHASVTTRTLRTRRSRIGHGVHVSLAVRAAQHGKHCEHGGPGGLGDATVTARAAERVAERRRAGAAEGRSSVARGDGDYGRASGRFTSGRYQHSEGLRPGPRARRLSEGRPATRSRRARPQITAVTAPITTFAALITAIPVTWSGQRARGPRRRRPPRQRLSPGRAGGTKSIGDGNSPSQRDCWISNLA